MARGLTVAAAQLGPFAESKEAMVGRMTSLVEQAAEAGVEALTFPELALSPYFPRALSDDFDRWFEPEMPSPLTRPLFDAARAAGIAFVLPYAELADDRYFNSAISIHAVPNLTGFVPNRASSSSATDVPKSPSAS